MLCLSLDMTSVEWAAWVQAIGSILAIVGAVGIAIWQSRRQHRSAVELIAHEQAHQKYELATTLHTLSSNCLKAMKHLSEQVSSREKVHEIAGAESTLIWMN